MSISMKTTCCFPNDGNDFLDPSPPLGEGSYKKLNIDISCWQLRHLAVVIVTIDGPGVVHVVSSFLQ